MRITTVVALVACLVVVHAQTFQHPGVLVSQSQLDYMKQQVLLKSEPFFTAFLKALNSTFGDLEYKARGPPESGIINCGFYSHPDDGCTDDSYDGATAYIQALLWVITGNPRYAENSIALMNKYSSTLKSFNNSNAGLQAAWSGLKWTRAAEIIRYSNANWTQENITSFSDMLLRAHLPQIINGSDYNGNWELAMIEAMMGISVFTEDWWLFNHSVTFWSQRVPAYYYYEPLDGNQPNPAPRGVAYWYGQTVFNSSVNGICQETCRDMGHTQYGIAASLNAAETARIQGVDLYGSQSARIMAAMEFNANLLLATSPPPSYVCNGTVNVSQHPTFEVGYNEYHNREGNSLPITLQQILTHVRTMENLSDGPYIAVWETLTHGGSPPSF